MSEGNRSITDMDWLLLQLVRGLSGTLTLLPYGRRIQLLSAGLRLGLRLFPHYGRIARRNLELAFPDQSAAWRAAVLGESCRTLATVLVDFLRIPQLDRKWFETHVEFPQRERYEEIRRSVQGGMICVSGHFGTFEYLPAYVAKVYAPIVVVIRKFKQSGVNQWWNAIRSSNGNVMISKKGAFKEIMRRLRSGWDVGILFDQNVTRSHAVFVDWFGRPAATTRALGLAAVRSGAPILLFAVLPNGTDRYRLVMREFNHALLYRDPNLSLDEKVQQITQELSQAFEEFIREWPAGWFWLHKRWRTTPTADIPEDFYAGC